MRQNGLEKNPLAVVGGEEEGLRGKALDAGALIRRASQHSAEGTSMGK